MKSTDVSSQAYTIERTQTQQTTVRETSVAPGPTQTVTSTQLTTYVSTFTTSFPYTTTLPGRSIQSTEVDASHFVRPCPNVRASKLQEARQQDLGEVQVGLKLMVVRSTLFILRSEQSEALTLYNLVQIAMNAR